MKLCLIHLYIYKFTLPKKLFFEKFTQELVILQIERKFKVFIAILTGERLFMITKFFVYLVITNYFERFVAYYTNIRLFTSVN